MISSDSARVQRVVDSVTEWPVDHAAAIVVGEGRELGRAGDTDREFRLASVTKPLVAVAALVACEEEAIGLDDAAGPEGSTVRHLLAHASGLDFADRDKVRCAPGERRIYSSAGFEVLADHIAAATGIPFDEYLDQAVCRPLGMEATVLRGPAGHGAVSTAEDLARFGAELLAPTLLHPDTLAEAFEVQFAELDGVVPGFGMQKPCPWGLGFEIRGAKHPHWTGSHNSPDTVGHFGQSGTFLWLQPELRAVTVALTDRDFGDWCTPLWPDFDDAVVDALVSRHAEA